MITLKRKYETPHTLIMPLSVQLSLLSDSNGNAKQADDYNGHADEMQQGAKDFTMWDDMGDDFAVWEE